MIILRSNTQSNYYLRMA